MEKLSTVIFLIRHGQTDRAYSTDPNLDGERILTEQGRAQLNKVGEYLKSFAPSKIYSSPVKRTIESAEVIKEQIGDITIETTQRLFEVYSNERFNESFTDGPKFLQELAQKHTGEHIICVSHQDVIEQFVRGLGATNEEAQFPCKTAQGYRVVLAQDIFVEITKISPADAV